MTFEQWRYGDPLAILIAAERWSCKGCAHAAAAFDRQYCGKGKKYGRRCAQYTLEVQGEKTMPQVRKIEVVDTFHAQTPYQRVMNIWARYTRLDDHQYSDGEAHPQDVKEFMRAGQAIDVMIDALPRHLWWAVRKGHGICTVWNFPHLVLEDALQAAEDILLPKMKNHVDVRRFLN